MLALFNNGVDKMSHVVNFGQDTLTERPRLVGHFTQFFITHLARDDSCPTPSWFFTFREGIDRMTAMHLVGFPNNALTLGRDNLREESQKRIKMILAFFRHSKTIQCLRRTSLRFQIIGGVEALMTANRNSNAPPLSVHTVRVKRIILFPSVCSAYLPSCLWILPWRSVLLQAQ